MHAKIYGLLAVALLTAAPVAGQSGGFRGGFDPSAFIRRMDTNGNGQIDPNEAEGRAGYFLRRLAENDSKIDLSQPVPIERIEKAMAEARSRWSSGRSGGDRDDDDDDDRRRDSRDSSRSSSSDEEPLVPGFGIETQAPLVPGFNLTTAATGLVRVRDEDREEAARRFRYYDRNRDGVLDEEEMRRVRSRDYQDYDSNRDGKLTLEELAVRYAKRRVEEEAEDRRESSSSRVSSSRRDDDDDDARRDSDDRRRGWYGRRDDRDSRSREGDDGGAPLRLTTDAERLEKIGAPSWFRDADANADGQVAMAEYSDNWSAGTLEEFATFDLNRDGLITPDECFKATKAGASRSSSSSRSSSASRSSYGSRSGGGFTRAPSSRSSYSSSRSDRRDDKENDDDSDDEQQSAADEETTDEAGASAKTSAPVKIDPRYLNYAQGRIKQLDANGDGLLQPDEVAKMRTKPEGADTSGDGLITAEELAVFYMQR